MTPVPRKLTLALASALAAVIGSSAPVTAGAGNTADRSAKPMTIAVIGDVPYGIPQEASFGELIGAVNDDPKVRVVVHVGDITPASATPPLRRSRSPRSKHGSPLLCPGLTRHSMPLSDPVCRGWSWRCKRTPGTRFP